MTFARQSASCICQGRNPKYSGNNRHFATKKHNIYLHLKSKVNNIKKVVYDNISQCKTLRELSNIDGVENRKS